jgi:IS30 family transposase
VSYAAKRVPSVLDKSSFDRMDDTAWRLNTRPRKTLGWKAPAELFLPEGASDFVQHWSAKIVPVALGA